MSWAMYEKKDYKRPIFGTYDCQYRTRLAVNSIKSIACHLSALTLTQINAILPTRQLRKDCFMPQVMDRPTGKAVRTPRSGVNFSVRMSHELKTQSEELYRSLGMPLTTAIQVFLKKSLAVGGLPFELKVSPPPIPDMAMMTRSEFDSELQRGYDLAMAGDLIDARQAHAELMDKIASWNTRQN